MTTNSQNVFNNSLKHKKMSKKLTEIENKFDKFIDNEMMMLSMDDKFELIENLIANLGNREDELNEEDEQDEE